MGNSVSSSDEGKMKSGECPVKHSEKTSKCPTVQTAHPSECPMAQKKVYNVYSQEIDPTNQMPLNPNQEPKEGQKYPLYTERVKSTIPKGNLDEGETWTYPSEQMFFNAMKRKGKGDDVQEGDVPSIVAIHNNMNERTWLQVKAWEEALHPGSNPKLLRFIGRPDELSPIARLKKLISGEEPFDRHDWFITRDDGKEVRYVIDYYFDSKKSEGDVTPQLHSADSIKSISMFTRPAIDSVGSLIDRIKYPILEKTGGLPQVSFSNVQEVEDDNVIEQLPASEVNAMFKKIQTNCADCFKEVKMCDSEVACMQASTALQYCMGKIVCKKEAEDFNHALNNGTGEEVNDAFDIMNTRIEQFGERSAAVLREKSIIEAAKE